MGRRSTGAITTGQCLQVPISAVCKHLNKGNISLDSSINYSSGASIGVRIKCFDGNHTITLHYSKTVHGEKKNISYDVMISSVPSNLSKGVLYYFICPFTFKRCKVLYMGYGSLYFKSRNAYSNRIYYVSQLSSHNDKHNDAYWALKRKLETLYDRHPKSDYKGSKTRAQLRIERLEEKKDYRECMRSVVLPKRVSKILDLSYKN